MEVDMVMLVVMEMKQDMVREVVEENMKDMVMKPPLSPDEQTGIVSCRWEGFKLRKVVTCPREESLKYALDNQLFLDISALAWDKLITNNYDDDNQLTKIIPNVFSDKRNNNPTNTPTKQPTPIPILIKITKEPTINNGNDKLFCCIAKKIPNCNGRCWVNLHENDCMNEAPGNGKRCYWDNNNCRNEQKCALRNES